MFVGNLHIMIREYFTKCVDTHLVVHGEKGAVQRSVYAQLCTLWISQYMNMTPHVIIILSGNCLIYFKMSTDN